MTEVAQSNSTSTANCTVTELQYMYSQLDLLHDDACDALDRLETENVELRSRIAALVG